MPEMDGELMWKDRGMCCEVEPHFSAFAPSISDGSQLDWTVLGQRAQPNHNKNLDKPMYMFAGKNADASPAPLVTPEGFTFIWDDRLSTSFSDGSVWRLNCPIGKSTIQHGKPIINFNCLFLF